MSPTGPKRSTFQLNAGADLSFYKKALLCTSKAYPVLSRKCIESIHSCNSDEIRDKSPSNRPSMFILNFTNYIRD